MKRRYIASMMIASASIFVVGITPAAQDRFTLKSPNGMRFRNSRATTSGRWLPRASPTTQADAVRLQILGASRRFWGIP